MGSVVEVQNVCKMFGSFQALDHVSMSMEEGKIYGLIGRNGSGKTVLIKCICGFMTPTSGAILVDHQPVHPGKAQNMGIIIENPGFVDALSGFRNLKLLASIGGKLTDEQIRQVIRQVGLDPEEKKAVKKYSLGMRHRLAIAQAIMENPPLLLLDEPMNGLDKQGVAEIRRLLLTLKEQGTTILLASHYEEDIKMLCDQVFEMDKGRLSLRREEITGEQGEI